MVLSSLFEAKNDTERGQLMEQTREKFVYIYIYIYSVLTQVFGDGPLIF